MDSHHIFFVLSVFLILAAPSKSQEVLVTVEEGTLRGETVVGVYGANYSRFLGVPYAQPPVGELRFQDPVPVSSWEGVRDAIQEASHCTQVGEGSEDCLYLNVYVPSGTGPDDALPVVFWVHGGGLFEGSATYRGPDFLVAYGVIMVAIAYRLGPLGFLSLANEAVPGNAGLKDQLLGLQWVQRNIANFGGDPERVMLMGESAGGFSASLHLVSPKSAGLFSRIAIQSGTFVSSMTLVRNSSRNAFKLGEALGFETEDPQQLLDFLRSVDAEELVNAQIPLDEEEQWYFSYGTWSPTIEPDIDGAFLSESPIEILNEGRFNLVPIIIGATSGELGVSALSDDTLIEHLNEDFQRVVGPSLHLPTTEWQAEAALLLRDFYFGDDTISAANPDQLCNLTNDLTFFDATDSLVRKVAEVTDVPVYYYEFDYRGPNVGVTVCGVMHAAELSYIFERSSDPQDLNPESEEDGVRRNVLTLWTNFARYGNPTPDADGPLLWEPYNDESRSYLLMQANFTLQSGKDADRMDFWHENVPLLPYPGTF